MLIRGALSLIDRESGIRCPSSPEHRFNRGRGGGIKGHSCATIDDVRVFWGMSSFYYPLDSVWGVKVAFSFGRMRPSGRAPQILRRSIALSRAGLGPAVGEKVAVDLDFVWSGARLVFARVAGVKIQRIFPPEPAWSRLATGRAYDFESLPLDRHPDHTPDAFLAFVAKVRDACPRHNAVKLGDIGYCTTRRRWFVLDSGP